MIYKIIAEHIQKNIPGCSFVGIEENTGELLVSFDHEDDGRKRLDTAHLMDRFPIVSKVIIVEHVDYKKAVEMIDALGKFLADKRGADLSDLEDF